MIPGPDPGACPLCGGWMRAGMGHVCSTVKHPVIETLLPRTDLTLHDARQKLAGWHFGQESLSQREREILYVAEAVLRGWDNEDGEQKMGA